jgi:hypothetical protein
VENCERISYGIVRQAAGTTTTMYGSVHARRLSVLAVLCVDLGFAAACAPELDPLGGEETGGAGGEAEVTTSPSTGPDADAGDGDGDAGTSPTTASGDGDGDGTTTTTTTTGDGDGDGDGDGTTNTGDGDGTWGDGDGCVADTLPDGSSCECGDQCASGKCYVVPLIGGQCGECESDADCPNGGCSIPNPLAGTGSACNSGNLGAGCESDAVCSAGLTCETVMDVAGIITVLGCSSCATDSQCAGDLCIPVVSVQDFSGHWECSAPGSTPNGQSCDLDGSGDLACVNDCAEANIMGLVTLGVCSDCDEDADCSAGQVCADPEVDITTGDVTPSVCVPGP